jgi:serine/threonine-protein kinase
MSPQVPTAIARYQIVRALGEGGMGSVYLAKDPAIDRFVAIKLLRSGFDDESARERFRREAKAIGQLHHINIVTIFDVGEHEGDPFIAMEYVEGHTIAQVVRSGAEVALDSALNWMDGLCAGLHYAHRRGIIHRDIKPANLVVDEENKVKILDFGIARGPASGMTQVGMLMGTLNYMSPEQLSGKTIDHRSDIFAVGGVFYELLTGKQAFPGDINSGVLHKILMGQPDSLRQLAPTVSDGVATIVERCLAKDPDARYHDLEAVRKDLTRARARLDHGIAETTVRMRPGGDVSGARAGRTPGEKTRAELLRQRRERIHQQLTRAREAMAARELAVAADACNQALILDPENVEAFELQERVERLEQAQQWLAEAQNELARGGVTAASLLLGRVAEIDPEAPEAAPLREKVAAERRRQEEQQRRAQALQDALARAREALGRDEIDRATEALAQARAVDAAHPDVAGLSKAITERAAAIKRAQEDARAQAAVAEAKRRFGAGQHLSAIELLTGYTPAHPLIAEARAALEFERGEILRREEEERRRLDAKRRAEAEERRREEEARRQAEALKRREEEERRRLEARRQAEEKKRLEAAEKTRLEAEARRRDEEAKRRAEDEWRKEAERKEAARKEAERKAADASAREDAARRAAEEKRQAAERQAAEQARVKAERDAAARRAQEEAAAGAADDKTIVMFPPFQVGQPAGKPTEPVVTAKAPAPAPRPPVSAPPPPPPPAPVPDVSGGQLRTAGTFDLPSGGTITDDGPSLLRWPLPRPVQLGLMGGAALVLVIVVWQLWPSGGGGGGTGVVPADVLIDIRPWAVIESVTTAAGDPVTVACPATPCVVSLPAGEYHVRARNPFFPNALEFDVSVTGDGYQEVRRALPDFNAEEEARRILGGR